MNKKFSRILSIALALMLCVALAAPAMAADAAISTGKVEIDKKLNVDQYAVLPADIEFEFTLAAVAGPSDISGFSSRTGNLTGIAVTAATGTTSTDVDVTGLSSGTIKVKYSTTDKPGTDTSTTAITKGFEIDFNSVTWADTGVYRYTVKEVAGSNTAISYDSTTTYYIDVFVVQGETNLEIGGIIVSTDGTYSAEAGESGNNYANKVGKGTIENTWKTHDLTVTKSVTGNQGNKNKEFHFTVTFTGLVDGQTYHYIENGQAKTFTGGQSATITLTNGQSATFYDLPEGATYTVVETEANQDGYTTTYSDGNGTGTIGTADVSVTVTNNKEGTVPTGVLLTIAPFAALMAVGGLGAVVILKRKKEEED